MAHEDEYEKQFNALVQYREETSGQQLNGAPQLATAAGSSQSSGGVHWQSHEEVLDPLIYPNLYAPSGFDMMGILVRVYRRPNPTIDLGMVDSSVSLLLGDMLSPDIPIVYCSEPFQVLTGYRSDEIVGQNCRFLQQPPDSPAYEAADQPAHPSMSRGERSLRRNNADKEAREARKSNKSAKQELREKMRNGEEVRVRMVNFKKDGKKFLNVLTAIPISWEDGADMRYVVGFQAEEVGYR